ncbi:unnamed protein product, partial [Sphacelaria rigidula]
VVNAEDAERLALEAEAKKQSDLDTTTRQSFVRYSADAAKAARPNRINRKGNTTACVKYQSTHGERCGGEGKACELQCQDYDYTTGPTATLWSMGGFVPRASDQESFGRSTQFTEPLYHQWLPDVVLGPIDSSLPRGLTEKDAEALTFLKRRISERGAEKDLPSVRAGHIPTPLGLSATKGSEKVGETHS